MDPKVRKIAVFDFDGTLTKTQSGAQLSNYLMLDGKMSALTYLRLLIWGIKYKLHIVKNQDLSRKLVFKSFSGKKIEEVDEYLKKFFYETLAKQTRDDIIACIEKQKKYDIEPVIVSASFWPIIKCFADQYKVKHFVATSMERDDFGCYTGNLTKESVVGENKVISLEKYCDQEFGRNGWEIEFAYADHISDRKILDKAKNPVAVYPD